MKRDTTKRFYEIHSWVGAFTAILIFVVCYTGAVSVFGRPEIKVWASETIRAPVNIMPKVVENLVRESAQTVPEAFREKITIIFPAVRRAEYLSINFEHEIDLDGGGHDHQIIRLDFDPATLINIRRVEGDQQELFARDKVDIADFIIRFHANLHLGSPWGLWLTGALGLTLFASIVTGILIHRKLLKELFTFRPWRSYRLLLTDTHKVLGVWGTLFHLTIAFTGAFLGLVVVALLPAAALVSFGGDQERLIETFLPEPSVVLSHQYSDIMIADVLEQVYGHNAGTVTSATIYAGNDQNALAVINTLAGEGMVGRIMSYRAGTAELLSNETTFSPIGSMTAKVFDLMAPLHFGNFGGVPIKFLWGVLGLSTAILGLTGMMIWLERRTQSAVGRLSDASYQRICSFTAGSCGGVVIAVASLFYSQLFLKVPDQDFGFWVGLVFFGAWGASIVAAFFIRSNYLAVKSFILLAAVMHLCIPMVNGLVTGDHIFHALLHGKRVVAGVDLTHLIYGAVLFWTAIQLPEQVSREKNSKEAKGGQQDSLVALK